MLAILAGFVCGLGDVVAQVLIERKQLNKYDPPRTLRMAAVGLFFTVRSQHLILYSKFFMVQGPILRGWFITLDKGFGPTKTIQDAAKKLFFDQIVFAPLLLAVLLPMLGFSQGMDKIKVKKKLRAVS